MSSLAAEMAAALTAHEEVFRYWRGLRLNGQLPSRRRFDPCQVRRRLPTISLIDVIDDSGAGPLAPHNFRQRLAGTELFSAYGTEITGKRLSDIYAETEAAEWARDLTEIVRTRKPNVGLQSRKWAGANGLYLFWVRLPMASDGMNVDMILGHDVLIGRPDISNQTGIRAA